MCILYVTYIAHGGLRLLQLSLKFDSLLVSGGQLTFLCSSLRRCGSTSENTARNMGECEGDI